MTATRMLEIELMANAHPGHRSAALLLECLAALRERDERMAKRAARSGKRLGFTPPTLEAVQEFFASGDVFAGAAAKEQGEAFWDFYESKSWIVGRVKMSDWKAAARGWERRNKIAPPSLGRALAAPRL